MKQDGKKLPADVAGRYQVLKGHGVGEYHYKGHVVHLDQLSLAGAEKLVAAGFPYLVTLPAKSNQKKTDEESA
jgi:hypothetical protein